jgi:hypothetical protein
VFILPSWCGEGTFGWNPVTGKMWACHNQIAKTETSLLLAPLKQAVIVETFGVGSRGAGSDFVQFNHRAHCAEETEECHGDVEADGCQNRKSSTWASVSIVIRKTLAMTTKLVSIVDCSTCHCLRVRGNQND